MFPSRFSPYVNTANRSCRATQPEKQGFYITESFKRFLKSTDGTLLEWEEWFEEHHPNSVQLGTDVLMNLLRKDWPPEGGVQGRSPKDVENDVALWVYDLMVTKTYEGLTIQCAVLPDIAKRLGLPFRESSTAEESRGIAGWIGKYPVSLKPDSFKEKRIVIEEFDAPIVFYHKRKCGGVAYDATAFYESLDEVDQVEYD